MNIHVIVEQDGNGVLAMFGSTKYTSIEIQRAVDAAINAAIDHGTLAPDVFDEAEELLDLDIQRIGSGNKFTFTVGEF